MRLGLAALALTASLVGASAAPAAEPLRDGSHDFDFKIGNWRTEITRTLNPFAGGDQTVKLQGSVTVRKVWDGRAALEEIEADGPNGHWEAATLFLYNPGAHQWSQAYVNSKSGVIAQPTVGSFHDGRGELYASDTYDGRAILVRGTWSEITADSHRYQEDYSDDGGRTWRTAFDARLTRVKG